ncbi:PEP/pyruvate-binding domain-containing protein [Cytophagaceae bacterium BD1B2-1]|uniref:Phosphoenolpyruvate synthase n=1 Tax=Xanthocytophaga agilis TaxID=3048010 RepID=A0AAE3UB65_9BACT|nr:PEP/pyruvate-binding domain-containing protein [Xanthocytophaga agilis]
MGKGANLGELSLIEGICVLDGFCISTEAFKKVIDATPLVSELLAKLSLMKLGDQEQIHKYSSEIRRAFEEITIPEKIQEGLTRHLTRFGENNAFAIRSSATAEDLPTASFAGQQDTYLNIIGKEAILQHISKCWASLFSERAITYHLQNGFDHHTVYLSVIVQKMVFPQAAGIMVTANPVSGNRKVVSIDASFGLGEALVSGLVNADVYKVRNGQITNTKISNKQLAIYALPTGGTKQREIELDLQNQQVLTNDHILQLEHIADIRSKPILATLRISNGVW